MEDASPRSAAFRLLALGGVVTLAIGLAAVAVVRQLTPAVAAETVAAPLPTEAAPAWTPVSVEPVPTVAIPIPEYVDPPVADLGPVIEINAESAGPFAGYKPPGALVVHNPAAMGPPEDSNEAPLPVVSPSYPATEPVVEIAAKEPTVSPPVAAPRPQAVERRVSPPPVVLEPIEEKPSPTPPTPAVVSEPSASPPQPKVVAPATYTASTTDLSRRLEADVRDGFRLGRAGAVYAARSRFIKVLRRIARAKDAEQGDTDASLALAEGLRVLDDADDFVARGDALEAELDVASIARSHGAELLPTEEAVAPHAAIEIYSEYAAARLAEATSNEPAGSMALYGLGKTYARLEDQSDDPTAGRKSTVMYRAAVDAQPTNYLAANELGVRLAAMGRYEQASRVLRAAAVQPGTIAMIHANLAAVENRLGRGAEAAEAQQASQLIAAQERARGDVSRRMGVQWVDPADFARSGPAQPGRSGAAAAIAPQPAPPVASATQEAANGWTGFVQAAKRVTGWSTTEPSRSPQPRAPVVTQRVLR